MDEAQEVVHVTPAELKAELDAGRPVFLVDLRNREEFGRWRIQGRHPVPTANLPYVEYVGDEDRLFAQLPKDRPITFVCGKGGASAYFAGLAREQGYEARNLAGGMEAWGNFYEARHVVEGEDLTILQVSRPARGCLSYLLASAGEAVVVDPLRHGDRYVELAAARGWRIVAVLDTHGHADHISSGRALADRLGVPYYLHPYDAIHPIDVLPATIAYEPLRDGATIPFGRAWLEALHVPGHTLGNTVYRVSGKYLLTGDTLFIESVARPDLGGRAEPWSPLHYRSLLRLLELPDDTVILPGHFSSPAEAGGDGVFAATLGELKQRNKALQVLREGEERFVSYMLSNLPAFPPEYVDIKRVNAGLLAPDEERAAELELGPNICALSEAYRGR